MKNFLFLAAFLLCICFACKEEADDFVPDFGFDYYPLSVGEVRHFEVDTVYFSTANPRFDTVYSQLREVITGTLLNNTGDTIYRVEHSERKTSDDAFEITDIYSEELNNFNIYRTEENLRFLKLPLPPTVNKTWDGNAEIADDRTVSVAGESLEMFKSWEYRILSKGETEEINGKTYEDVLTVQLADSDSEIEYRYGVEKYARGTGLIYRELWILDTQCKGCCDAPDGTIPLECTELPWELRADEGFIMRQFRTE